jgi:peptide/nickel transport system permease protein
MRPFAFIFKRAAELVLLVFLVTFITFWLSAVIPGDFFSAHMADSPITMESVALLRHQYGLDQPFHIQYLRWMEKLFRLDFGYSLFYQRPVSSVVADALVKTLWIGVPAFILGFAAGVLLGTVHGMAAERGIGKLLNFVTTVALSLPSILLGLAALLFAAHTGWFPLGGMESVNQQANALQWSLDRLRHLFLPVACLGIPVMASIERVQFAAVRSIGKELYLRCARTRGLGSLRIFFQYFLRPGLNPALSVSGPMIGWVLSGSLVLEVIFSWPGLGQITYDALFNSDLFLLAGCVIGSSALLVIGNLLADLAMISFDPRTRSLMRGGSQ